MSKNIWSSQKEGNVYATWSNNVYQDEIWLPGVTEIPNYGLLNLFKRLLRIPLKWCLHLEVMERRVSFGSDQETTDRTNRTDWEKRNAIQSCKARSNTSLATRSTEKMKLGMVHDVQQKA
jgi:hypothetical protein